ncbi:GlxA family transcriptional regulator [Streptomyces bambusae]|uniref:Helix-turn-helix domain-containing protein n=1 Tax=Streptomyces bambusae TaxID=1550616 RepID=A0ABS6ZF88_9ACTN|nr:GlxA family transcriptional regulator [Streptomyces bambusae]MBW5486434.1 helix-turn-helix domain-containing protein [Streptomyces bambusae]
MQLREVLVVIYDGVQSLDVSGPVEVFAGAVKLLGGSGYGDGARGGYAQEPPPYRIRTASLGGAPVRSNSVLTLLPDGDLAEEVPGPDTTLVVPGGQPRGDFDPRLTEWLRAYGGRAGRLVSVCTGGLLLAEAGLLDGRRATTHWAWCERMARQYPAVRVEPEPIYVRDGRVATSAGVTAGIDLALALVEEDLGRDAALTIARHLVVYLRRPGNQAQFSAQLSAQTAQREPLRDVQQWIAEHPGEDLSVEALAERARLSPRHFARAFQSETGVTPGRYVERVRVEHARRLLEDSGEGIAEISRACGYGTPEALRRAFVKTVGQPPTEYRRRFGHDPARP